MAYEIAVQRLLEWRRLYVEVEFTEDGAYALGEVPESYSGSFLARIEVCFAVIQVDGAGRLRLQTFNPPDIKNKDDETGMPLKIVDGHTVRAGEKSPDINLTWRENGNLPQEQRDAAAAMWSAWTTELGEWVL